MPVRLITDLSEFAALKSAWNGMAGHAAFRRWEWMYGWAETYQATHRLHLLQASDDGGRTIGYAPLALSRSRKKGRTLELLGSGKACGDDVSLLALPGCGEAVADAAADWLCRGAGATSWDWIRLEGVAAGDPVMKRLQERLSEAGAAALRRDDLSTWAIDVPPTWDEYLARFGKNGRHHLRSALRRLDDEKLALEYARPESREQCLAMFATIAELHGRRWQGTNHGGSFAAPGFREFLEAVVLRWFDEGSLWMRLLSSHGRPWVGALATLQGRHLHCYLFGREPECGRSDAGMIANAAMIHEAVGAGIEKFDFLRGDEEYKSRLLAKPSPQVLIEVAGRGVFNRVRYLAAKGRQTASAWRRRAKG
jgi:CelD/BcsL family acetyltransferase involved in cellulose biosynthesis